MTHKVYGGKDAAGRDTAKGKCGMYKKGRR